MLGVWIKDPDSGFPEPTREGWDVAECATWYREHSDPEVAKERAKKLRLESERLALKLEQERGAMVTSTEVEEKWSSVGATLRSEMDKTRRSISPMIAGKEAPEILVALEDRDREIMAKAGGVKP